MITWNVVRHLAVQLGTGLAFSGAAYLARADYSALGPYAVVAQGLAAGLTALINEALGTAPASSK